MISDINSIRDVKGEPFVLFRQKIMKLAARHKTPFYVIDNQSLENSIVGFKKAFSSHIDGCTPFYALKSNDHPFIVKSVIRHGFGIDVSSGRELGIARKCGAEKILFSGPGKTMEELGLALDNARFVTVHIDSFSELKKLGKLAQERKVKIKAGVRFFSSVHGTWSKFGIPLRELKSFWETARDFPYIDLQGLQFHISWNKDPSKYVKIIKELAEYLKESVPASILDEIKFLDFGGGFFPDRSDGYYPREKYGPGLVAGQIVGRKANSDNKRQRYYLIESSSLDEFAREISNALNAHIKPLIPKCAYYTEPGRIICNNAMHIVVSVLDKKREDRVISDGGINMTGWEYGENYYYPIFNLTHPSAEEIDCTVYGPLCTPRDLWGYYCYAEKMEEGDLLVVLNQGSYKYVLAQNFIKPIPKVYGMK
jgi:diaminopimelate decarboxylase